MSSNCSPRGTFIQILQADRGVVYRLLVEATESSFDITRCAAYAGKTNLEAAFCMPEGDATSPLHNAHSVVISVTLPDEEPRLRICYEGACVARMTPRRHALLRNRQNLLMVNPAIDGAFHTYLSVHNAMLQSAADQMPPFSLHPLISIVVPLFHTPPHYARSMLDSVMAQRYANWELVLVNASPEDEALSDVLAEYSDRRINIVPMNENLGIAGNTNAGIHACTGDYIAFLDHDDVLDPLALHMYVGALNEDPATDLFYCDEDNFHETLSDRYSPIFKPDFNIDLLYSHNYVEHFLMVSKWALDQVDLSPNDVRGAQDYDLTLKVAEIARGIYHAPYLLYHWRAHPGSTNGGNMDNKPYAIQASIHALDRHFERIGVDARARETDIPCVFSITYQPLKEPIHVALRYRSIEGLHASLACLAAQTHRDWLRIHPIGPAAGEALPIIEEYGLSASAAPAVKGETYAQALAPLFDIAEQEGTPLLLCSDAVHFDEIHCIERLSGCLRRSDIAIAAPKLFSPDGLVQHAGCHLGIEGDMRATLINQGFGAHMGGGYLGVAECCCDFGSISSDCLLIAPTRVSGAHRDFESWTSADALVHHLACTARSEKLNIVVLPEATATVNAPIIWDWHNERAQTIPKGDRERLEQLWPECLRHDPLDNPHVYFRNGYANLAVDRDIEKEARRIYWHDQLLGKR